MLSRLGLNVLSRTALLTLLVLAAGTRVVNSAEDVAKLAEWLQASSANSQLHWPRSASEFEMPARDRSADRDGLISLSADASTSPFERMAALALLHIGDSERDAAIRAFFKATGAHIGTPVVVYVEEYLEALQSRDEDVRPERPERRHMRRRPPPPRPFGDFTAEDLPLLARMALVERHGMAMAALGLVNDSRAVEVLVHAPFLGLGSRGINNANYQGLRFLCQDPESRTWVREYIYREDLSKPRRAMVVLALAAERDPAALEPLADLVRALTCPSDSAEDSRRRRHNRYPPMLPPHFSTDYVLYICGAWGEPILGRVISEFMDAGSGNTRSALAAARACGVTFDKPRLMRLATLTQCGGDVSVVLDALTPMLEPEDAGFIASMLAPARWSTDGFYLSVLHLHKVPAAVLSAEVRDALLAVAQEHPNQVVRLWASQALQLWRDLPDFGIEGEPQSERPRIPR